MQAGIDKIHVKEGRRKLNREYVGRLAESIRELGLLNPLTVDAGYNLIAGLHRLEAVKSLGWETVECTVRSLEGLRAEMAEIDENIVRNDLSAVEYGEILLRRKEIYETRYPETKATYNGGGFKGNQYQKVETEKISPAIKSFVRSTAEKAGISPRRVEMEIRTAKQLAPEAKEILKGTERKITKKAVAEIARMEPERQKEAASLLAAGEIRNMDEFKEKEEKRGQEAVQLQKGAAGRGTGASDKPEENEAQGKKEAGAGMPEAGNKKELRAEPDKKKEKQEIQEEGRTGSPSKTSLSKGTGASIRKLVAELKNPDKDCSGTPESFLEEYGAFVRKFHKEMEWYGSAYYEAVFRDMDETHLACLRMQTDAVCTAAEELYNKVKRGAEMG